MALWRWMQGEVASSLRTRLAVILSIGLSIWLIPISTLGALAGQPATIAESASNDSPILVPPFDVDASRREKGKRSKRNFVCDLVPSPVLTLSLKSKYAQTDGRADIDPERLDAYRKDTAPLEAFKRRLTVMANKYVAARPADPAIARCALSWMAVWAHHGALDHPGGEGDEAARAAALTAVSLAFLQIRDEPKLSERDKDVVLAWIGRLAERVRSDYGTGEERHSRQNNLRYWAAWSTMTASIALNDHDLFNWAVAGARIGLAQISADGTLPLEMERRQRALGYHVYSLQALVLLAEGAAANGVDLYGERDAALLRLAQKTFSGLENPSEFEEMTGFRQDLKDTINASKMSFVALLAERVATIDVSYWKRRIGSFRSTGLGGDVELIYGPRLRGAPT